jgi:hypothetical protein
MFHFLRTVQQTANLLSTFPKALLSTLPIREERTRYKIFKPRDLNFV